MGDMLNHSRKSLSECFAPVTRKRVGSSVVEQLTAGHQSEAKQSAGPGFDSLPALFVSPWNEDAEFFFSFFLLFFPGAERQTTTRPRVTRGPGRHGDGAQGLGGAGGRGRAGPGFLGLAWLLCRCCLVLYNNNTRYQSTAVPEYPQIYNHTTWADRHPWFTF